jgi:hypothetical protein
MGPLLWLWYMWARGIRDLVTSNFRQDNYCMDKKHMFLYILALQRGGNVLYSRFMLDASTGIHSAIDPYTSPSHSPIQIPARRPAGASDALQIFL